MATNLSPRKPTALFGFTRDPFNALRHEMDHLLGNWAEGAEGSVATLVPSVDISENEKELHVRVDLPGMKPEDIDVQIEKNVLTISGTRKEEREEKDKRYHRVERRTGTFSRSFALPVAVAESDIVAEYNDGVLDVKLPKIVEAQAKKIQIKK